MQRKERRRTGVRNDVCDDLADLAAISKHSRRSAAGRFDDVEGEAEALRFYLVRGNRLRDGAAEVEWVLEEEIVAFLRPRKVLREAESEQGVKTGEGIVQGDR